MLIDSDVINQFVICAYFLTSDVGRQWLLACSLSYLLQFNISLLSHAMSSPSDFLSVKALTLVFSQ